MIGHGPDCTCGGCRRPGEDPAAAENRPSLPTVSYRRGTFGSIRRTLLDRTTREASLARLSTRQPDDHAVATLELWAVVADVLEFYSERYLNEAYLGTATETRSVERLARLVGYRPRPGVAALAWLAFTLEPDTAALVPAGLAIQSVPGPTADGPPPPPVTFETLAPLAADARWNAVRAFVASGPAGPAFAAGQRRLVLRRGDAPELAATLKPNDTIVLWGSAGVEEKLLGSISTEPDRVVVEWANPVVGTAGSNPQARRFVRVLKAFGGSAPATWMRPTALASAPGGIKWDLVTTTFTVGAGSTTLALEGKSEDLEAGVSLLVVPAGATPRLVTVTDVRTANASVGPISDSVTQVVTSPALPAYDRRDVRIYLLAGPVLAFWGSDYPTTALLTALHVPVFRTTLPDGRIGVEIGRRIEAGSWVPGAALDLDDIEPDRRLLITWAGPERPERPATVAARLSQRPLLPAFDAQGFGHLRLDVSFSEAPSTDWGPVQIVSVLGNIVQASHGESVSEALGDGSAAAPFKRYTLGRKSLTYVPAKLPGGVVSSLSVSVDGVIWGEVPALYGQPATATVVETATNPDGSTTVRFGDGRTMGARPTTGIQNVRARYRVGTGLAGRVPAGRLTTLLARPPGVRGVVNPGPAEGGADPEPVGQSRRNAAASVRTLGRIVSLRDVESLALSSGLVAKAQALWLWSGFDRMIHLTVAASEGDPLSTTLRDLIGASLDAARDSSHRLRVDDRALVPVTLIANIIVDRLADRPDLVLGQAAKAARGALSFDAVALGMPLAASDLIAVLAGVPGVIGVDIDRFGYSPAAGFTAIELDERGIVRAADGTVAPVQPRLRILTARTGSSRGTVLPAELPYVRVPSDIQIVDGGQA